MPVVAVFPIIAVENRVQAHTANRDSNLERLVNLRPDLADPACASDAEMAGLRDQKRPFVPLPNPAQHAVQRDPAWIAGFVFPAQAVATQFPLIRMIEV